MKYSNEKLEEIKRSNRLYGAGWMHLECCTLLDKGEDPRGKDISEMIPRMLEDLDSTPEEPKKKKRSKD